MICTKCGRQMRHIFESQGGTLFMTNDPHFYQIDQADFDENLSVRLEGHWIISKKVVCVICTNTYRGQDVNRIPRLFSNSSIIRPFVIPPMDRCPRCDAGLHTIEKFEHYGGERNLFNGLPRAGKTYAYKRTKPIDYKKFYGFHCQWCNWKWERKHNINLLKFPPPVKELNHWQKETEAVLFDF